jgi:hypothetical protein
VSAHPEIGRPVEEMPPEFREWFTRVGKSGNVALYRYDGEVVTILAVRHGKDAGYDRIFLALRTRKRVLSSHSRRCSLTKSAAMTTWPEYVIGLPQVHRWSTVRTGTSIG